MQKLDEYVKIAEAAKILGVAENTLRSWADSGKLPVFGNPANGYRLFRQEDLTAYLKELGQSGKPRRPR